MNNFIKTLKELRAMQEAGQDVVIEYSEGATDDTPFAFAEVINPNVDDGSTIEAWVPAVNLDPGCAETYVGAN